MRIGIDIDGVLADLVTAFLPHLSSAAGRPILVEHITQYHMGRAIGLPEDAFQQVWKTAEESLYLEALPYPEVAHALELLSADHELFIQTGRPTIWTAHTSEWLLKHCGQLFSCEHRPARGAKFVAEDGLDAFIEDQYDTLIDQAQSVQLALLIDRPWNQGALPPNAVRVNDLMDAVDVLKGQGS